jgi:hypothetical protein
VAGAVSGGEILWSTAAAIASLSARNTLFASISGGSPTAFERCTVSSALRACSRMRMRQSRGRSLATGIL